MKLSDSSEFTNLTKAQVEALSQCFDFLHNGYLPLMDWNINGLWVIRLRHKANGHSIAVHIKDCCYAIYKDAKRVKYAAFNASPKRFFLSVDSDMKVRAHLMRSGAAERQVPG